MTNVPGAYFIALVSASASTLVEWTKILTLAIRPKKKIVCFRSPDRPYFEPPTLNFFLALQIRFSEVKKVPFSSDYFWSPKRFNDPL